MKEYNRATKRWEEPQEKLGSLKKAKLCRGGKPHDYQLTVPHHLRDHNEYTPEAVLEYYASEERIKNFIAHEMEILKSLGIVRARSFGFGSPITKYFVCSVCKKQEYEMEKK